MSIDEVNLLPKELSKLAVIQRGIIGWKISEIPEVVECCRKLNIAIFAGSIIIIFSDDYARDTGLAGIYPKVWTSTENWGEYVERSCVEFMKSFNTMISEVNIENEIFEILRSNFFEDREETIDNIMKHLYFELDVYTEVNYLIFKEKYFK
jgi:hypothetical protein